MDSNCKNCGSDEWVLLYENDYPERRTERDRTVERCYRCDACSKEGKHFEHNDGGPDQFTGVLR